jgi:hypothetical protein
VGRPALELPETPGRTVRLRVSIFSGRSFIAREAASCIVAPPNFCFTLAGRTEAGGPPRFLTFVLGPQLHGSLGSTGLRPMPPDYSRDLEHGPGAESGLLPRLPPPTCSRPVSGVGLGLCYAASLLRSPGLCSPTVLRSAICDCLSINGCFSSHYIFFSGNEYFLSEVPARCQTCLSFCAAAAFVF